MVSVSGLRGIVGTSLTPAVAARFAAAYGGWLLERGGEAAPHVVIGRDSRPSGPELQHAVAGALTGMGCRVTTLGVASTPGVGIMTVERGAQGGIVITASHNPDGWNGVKLLRAEGAAPPTEEARQIIARFEAMTGDPSPGGVFLSVAARPRRRVYHPLQMTPISPPKHELPRPPTPVADVISPERSPLEVIAAWPADAPLAALTSGSSPASHARWTIVASPTDRRLGYPDAINSISPALDTPAADAPDLPFTGGWIGWVSYEAGYTIEPTALRVDRLAGDSSWPDACMLRCPGAYVHDAQEGRWWGVGELGTLPAPDRMDRATPAQDDGYQIGEFISSAGREGYIRDAARVIGLIHAGDAFQVNLAHHLTAGFRGDARRMFTDLTRAVSPWFGAYIERPDGLGAICSLSPELFLHADFADRSVVTRPIKGTRPASGDANALQRSEKDSAELAMIVDLMRNDLGRVCEYGSIRVTEPRVIELHADSGGQGVLHGVATVEGVMREGVRLRELLDATSPPGSVTGAPKVRAMQIINELEPLPRGPYCGAIGFVSDSGHAAFSVGIRTASIAGRRLRDERPGQYEGRISFPVGAGLVADSDPEAEWVETLDKAAAFLKRVRRPIP